MTAQRVPLRLLSSLSALALVLALLPGSISSHAAAAACIDLNAASVEELTGIIHVGPSTAEVIVGMRPFDSVDGLTAISGIGPTRLDAIKDQGLACVGAAAPPPEQPPEHEEPTPSDPPEDGSPDVQDPPADDPADEAAPDGDGADPEGDGDDHGGGEDTDGDGDADSDRETEADAGPCVDLNTASVEDLQRIIHIGEVRAQAVVDGRPWGSVDDLVVVSGISDERLADIRAQGRVCPSVAVEPPDGGDDDSDDEPQHEGVMPLSFDVVDCAAPNLLTVVVVNPNSEQVPFTVRVDGDLVGPEQHADHGATTVPIEGWSGAGRVSLVWTGDLRNYGAATDVECEPALDPEPESDPERDAGPEPERTVPPGPEPTPEFDSGPSPEDPDDETTVADEVVEAPDGSGQEDGPEEEANGPSPEDAEEETDGTSSGGTEDETVVADEVVEAPADRQDGATSGDADGAPEGPDPADGGGESGAAPSDAEPTSMAGATGSPGIVTPTRVDAGGGGLVTGGGLATSGEPVATLWPLAALGALALIGLGAELRAAGGRRRETGAVGS